MADVRQLSNSQRRDALLLLLQNRGLTREQAQAHVDRLPPGDVSLDLAFHMREDEAAKASPPTTLPAAELLQHYMGPLHRLSQAEATAIIGQDHPELTTPPLSSAPPTQHGSGGSPMAAWEIAAGSVLVLLLAAATYVVGKKVMTARATEALPESESKPKRALEGRGARRE